MNSVRKRMKSRNLDSDSEESPLTIFTDDQSDEPTTIGEILERRARKILNAKIGLVLLILTIGTLSIVQLLASIQCENDCFEDSGFTSDSTYGLIIDISSLILAVLYFIPIIGYILLYYKMPNMVK